MPSYTGGLMVSHPWVPFWFCRHGMLSPRKLVSGRSTTRGAHTGAHTGANGLFTGEGTPPFPCDMAVSPCSPKLSSTLGMPFLEV